MKEEIKIVFYDGDCGFCNRSVQFILKKNTTKPFIYFASLQSDFAQNFFAKHNEPLPDLSSLVFFDSNAFYYKSTGALRIGIYLKSYRVICKLGLITPRFIRDFIYDIIAKNRNKLASKATCDLLTEEERNRFLAT